jgi:hypothetical protein
MMKWKSDMAKRIFVSVVVLLAVAQTSSAVVTFQQLDDNTLMVKAGLSDEQIKAACSSK